MKKKVNNKCEEDAVPQWQTIYCSLILIMLVLFVMLSSYSVADKGKMTDLGSNFKGDRLRGGVAGGPSIVDGSLSNDLEVTGAWVNRAALSLNKTGEKLGLAGGIIVKKMRDRVKLELRSDIAFPEGSALISRKIYPYLDEIIRITQENDLSLRIAGHTDDSSVRNNVFPSNWELSTARATNMLRYFMERGEIPSGRVTAAGFGQYSPLASNNTPEGKAQNRRVEVFMELKKL